MAGQQWGKEEAPYWGYTGVIPWAVHPTTGERYVLIGREHEEVGWDGSGRWSEFGGMAEGQPPVPAAAREMYEETMGMIGSAGAIARALRGSPRITFADGIVFTLRVPFDARLPAYFSRVHAYFRACARPHPTKKGFDYLPTCPEGYYEKTAVAWVPYRALRRLALQGVWDPQFGPRPDFRPEFVPTISRVIRERHLE